MESTSCGLNDGPLVGKGEYPAYIACALMDKNEYVDKAERGRMAPRITQDGEDRECEPGQYVKGIRDNCIIGYKYFTFEQCESVTFTVRGNAKGTLYIKLTEEGEPVASLPMELSVTEWEKITAPFAVDSEKSGFFLVWQGEGAFDLLSFSFA